MNVPPGLTCAACASPLTPSMATRTDDGWKHAGRCRCAVEDCHKASHAGGYCNGHYWRLKRYGDPLAGVKRSKQELHLDDVEWLAETGETFTRAADRLGFTEGALEKALVRAGRADLTRAMRAREVWVA